MSGTLFSSCGGGSEGPYHPTTEYEVRWDLNGQPCRYRTPDYLWAQGYAQRTANEEGIPVEVYRLYGNQERYLNTVHPEPDASEQARHSWNRGKSES